MPRVMPSIVKSWAVARVRIRALIHIGMMNRTMVTALLLYCLFARIQAAG